MQAITEVAVQSIEAARPIRQLLYTSLQTCCTLLTQANDKWDHIRTSRCYRPSAAYRTTEPVVSAAIMCFLSGICTQSGAPKLCTAMIIIFANLVAVALGA